MRLAEKVGKIGNWRAVESAQRHLKRVFFDWRHGLSPGLDGLISAVDPNSIRSVAQTSPRATRAMAGLVSQPSGNGWR